MISLELCEITLFFEKSRPQLQKILLTCSESQKYLLSLKQCSLTDFLNFKNVGL